MASAYRRRVGQRIKDARHELGLTQIALGRMVGAGLSTVQSWEQGKREPSVEARLCLAHVLRVDVDRLFSHSSQGRNVPEPGDPPGHPPTLT